MRNFFENYDLSSEIIDALNVLKYYEPTEIQKQVIPLALESKDIIGKSKTGSGKTAAFAIPLCERVIWDYNEPQILVLEPTRELTVQVKEEIYQIGRKKRIKVADLFGGFPIDKQIQTLKQKNHMVVGTPGRVHDHIRRGSLKLDRIKTVVIDEADLMLDMGFADDVELILGEISGEYQMMLFSATIGENVQELVDKYLNNPTEISIEEESDQQENGEIIQKCYRVSAENKYRDFLDILKSENPDHAMIFCGTKEMVNVLCRKLGRDKIKCGMIHGDIDQQDRIRTIDRFREGRIRFLIATNVIARGIDFDDLSHVFNYDFPTGKETYIHRIGRTGRNGASGTAVSLFTSEDENMKKQIEEFVGYNLPEYNLPTITAEEEKSFWKKQEHTPKIKKKKGSGFSKEIMKLAIGGGKKSKIRTGDLVGAISNIDGITSDDIGVIDVRASLSYVEIMNGKGEMVLEALQTKPIKGKVRKVRKST